MQIENKFAKLQLAESQTDTAFTKFLRVTIEAVPHRLSDKLLKTTPIKSIKSKKFEIYLQNLLR